MTLKETRPNGREKIYPDGNLIDRITLSEVFDCNIHSVERAIKRSDIEMIEVDDASMHWRRQISIDDFPKLIESIQENKDVKRKLQSEDVDTSVDFSVVAASRTIFEYTYPVR